MTSTVMSELSATQSRNLDLLTGNGYITTGTLKEILREIDSTLSEDNLDQIVEEVDDDGSGTVDFDEFMAMMTGE